MLCLSAFARGFNIFDQVYIERSDFRAVDEKGYYGLAPNKEVLLKYAYNIKCTEVITNNNGEVVELRATVDKNNSVKVKGMFCTLTPPTC